MGKYDEVIKKLKPLPIEKPAWQEKVRLVKLDIDLSTSGLALAWANLRAEKKRIEEELSQFEVVLEAHKQLIVCAYEIDSITSMKLVDGKSVSVQPEPHAVVEDREEFRLWCIEEGLERSLTLPWMTTNSLTKERLLQGEKEPDGVKAYIRDKLVLRKK